MPTGPRTDWTTDRNETAEGSSAAQRSLAYVQHAFADPTTGLCFDETVKKPRSLLACTALLLTACAPGTPSGPSSPAASPSTSTAASPTAFISTAPPAAPKGKSGASICQDVAGDSTSVDIDQVKLISDGSLLFMTFMTTADLPRTGTVQYSVTAWSPDGKSGYQMGAKFQNGVEVSNFVFDLSKNHQKNITNGAIAADKQVSTRYPLSEVAGLGDTFGWSGTVTVDGTDVDRCMDGDAKTTFPDS